MLPNVVVNLDEACRRQQVGEGWHASLDDVPKQAISMSIHQIMQSAHLICTVPDARKSAAVKAAVEGPVTPMAHASRLQQHPRTTQYLNWLAAAELSASSQYWQSRSATNITIVASAHGGTDEKGG